jgi:Holliday junction resolvase RusA-like endonuclease
MNARPITNPPEPLTFSVPGVPVPKGWPEFSSHHGRVTTRTPEKTVEYHRRVQMSAFLEMRGREKFAGAVEVTARFVFPLPASWSEKRKTAALGQPHVSRPNIDNLLKAVLDGLDAVAFTDDCSVEKISATKQWGCSGLVVCTVKALEATGAANE